MRLRLLQKRLPTWFVPSFFFVGTLLLVIFNDALGDDDTFIVFGLFFFLVMGLVFLRWLFLQIRLILNLKKEKKQTELLHLKSQVNPHFFFNTLNNLYGLVGQDTKKAQELILKLSEMMRYSIYEGQHDWVPLVEEIDYLNNYIELHRMRYHKTIEVQFNISVEDEKVKVMPLLFIILLENAFKHGVENLRKSAYIHLELRATKKRLDFEIENNFDPSELQSSQGIGLKNLQRRLDLVYPNKHQFTTNLVDHSFRAKLSLQL
ncbi:MAG: sensor histidine kinase [Saprospiraceae bacterium]